MVSKRRPLSALRNTLVFLCLFTALSLLAGLAGPLDVLTLVLALSSALLIMLAFNYFAKKGQRGRSGAL
jgi:hypothetical protein